MKYYSLKNILSKNAVYNMIIGERSNGKTYACLAYAIERYWKEGVQTAYVRRWAEDLKAKKASQLFAGHAENGYISKITNGIWTDTWFYAGKWYLCKYDEDGNRIIDETPFCYFFAITAMEHDKSVSYPNIKIIIFDEFITRSMYVPDEFILFCNVLSTIIRLNTDIIIFMLGNTVNKYCPYFNEMGLKHVKDMQQGSIDLYKYGDSRLTVAVEYVLPNKNGKPSDFYFAFDNPKLQMITTGTWEMEIYPHLPVKYKTDNILFRYYICFDNDILECEIIEKDNMYFTFIHRKTTPLKDPDNDLIYTTDIDARPNFNRNILKPTNKICKKIYDLFVKEKIFYATNEIGEIVRNYILWCKKSGQD